MVGREMRASWRRLLFFFLCIAIGVGAIVALRSVIQSVRGVLAREARALIAADVVVQSTRPWDAATIAVVDRGSAPRPASRQQSEVVETATMVRADRPSRRRRGWWSCARSSRRFRSTAR